MKLINWFFIALGLTIIVMFVLDNYYLESFFAFLIAGLLFGWTIIYINILHSRMNKDNKNKNSIRYWFDVANQQLIRMPGGKPMYWDNATDKIIEPRTFKSGKETKHYVAFYGRFESVIGVCILCLEDEAIVRLNTRPNPELFNDPFYNFKPEESGSSNFGGFNDWDNRKRDGINFHFGNKDNKDRFDIDDDFARKVGGFDKE